jgi:hypothetical protein
VNPRLRPDLEIDVSRTRWGEAHTLLHSRAADSYLLFSGPKAALLTALDGTRTFEEVLARGTTLGLSDAAVTTMLAELRRARMLTEPPAVDLYATLAERLRLGPSPLRTRIWWRLTHPGFEIHHSDRFFAAVHRRGGRLLFTWPSLVVILALGLGGLWTLLASYGGRVLVDAPHLSPAAAALVWVACTLSGFLHECGHALAVRYAGRRVRDVGGRFYLGFLVFFVDSTDLLLAEPRKRVVNAVAGISANLLVAGGCSVAAWRLDDHHAARTALVVTAVFQFRSVILNLIPLVEFDGYYLLTDLIDAPHLRERALHTARHALVERVRRRRGPLTRAERNLACFGVATVVATVLVAAWSLALWIPLFASLGGGLWSVGPLGQVGVLVVAALVVVSLSDDAARLRQRVAPRIRRWRAQSRFRAERGWRVDAAELVAALPLSEPLSDRDLGDLAGRVTRHHVGRGRAVAAAGEAAYQVFLVGRGSVAGVTRGVLLGLEELRARARFGVTLLADERSTLYAIDAHTFFRLLDRRLT